MGMTIAERILATKSGAARVSPGEIVDAYPDVVMSHTATWRSVAVMKRIGEHEQAWHGAIGVVAQLVANPLHALGGAQVDVDHDA